MGNMQEYHLIIESLKEVYSGKNLKEVIFKYNDNKYRNKIKNHCYQILKNYYSIKFIMNELLKKTPNEDVELILQIGLYELGYSVKPIYAVVNDLVNLTKKYNPNYKNLVNAVLQNYLRKKELFVQKVEENKIHVNLSNWLIDQIKENYPERYEQIFTAFNTEPKTTLRLNKRKINLEDYVQILKENKIEYQINNDIITLDKETSIGSIPFFTDGYVSIQDSAAQYLLNILARYSIQPKKALDACAAPGGKTCLLLENYEVDLTALDNSINRLDRIKENLNRLDLNCECILADAASKNWWNKKKYDFILADVPCSAIGTIKKNPDIRINRLKTDIPKFVELQRKIVVNLFDMLETDGYMLYVTCSILKDENEDNVKWFSKNIVGFELITDIQILPDLYNDGLYYALIKKSSK